MSAVCGNVFERWFVLLLKNENQPKMKKAKQMEREAIINFNKNEVLLYRKYKYPYFLAPY